MSVTHPPAVVEALRRWGHDTQDVRAEEPPPGDGVAPWVSEATVGLLEPLCLVWAGEGWKGRCAGLTMAGRDARHAAVYGGPAPSQWMRREEA